MRPIVGRGTPESRWQADGRLGRLPELVVTGLDRPPLIVAPHPDDEILGTAGLLALAGGEVVAVTDGELSHPGSTVVDPTLLGPARRAETAAALAALGRPATVVHRLSHPDNGIDEDRLTDELVGLLTPGRWCVVTWRADGHPDHEVVGRAAVRACARTGAKLVEYPIWMWHWADPADPADPADDDDVPWQRAFRLPLPAAVRAQKRAAIAAFVSQVLPVGSADADAAILPPHVVARFDRAEEVFFV